MLINYKIKKTNKYKNDKIVSFGISLFCYVEFFYILKSLSLSTAYRLDKI